jgi:hypothetical protein
MKRFLSAFVVVLLVFLAFSKLNAQDTGDPDTCRITSNTWIIDSPADSLLTVELWGWIDDPLIRAASLGFRMFTSGSVGYGPHVDSLVIIDTFFFDPGITTAIQNYQRSLLDESIDPGAPDWGYNGFSVGLVDFVNPIFPIGVSARVGEVVLKVLDRERVPEEFTIEIDSSFFPPAGTFKYSPTGGSGFPPQFVKSVIDVHNDLTPELTSIDPNSAVQGDNLTVTITGYRTHFGEGSETQVVFTLGAEVIAATSVSVTDATLLDADFSIPVDATTGDYDVTVSVDGFPDVTEVAGFGVRPPYLCGDPNDDEKQNISDIVWLLDFIFIFGPEPIPYISGDVNCDGVVDIDDVVYYIYYIFYGGPAPCHPSGGPEPDC